MAESLETSVVSSGEPKKSSNTWLIVAVVVVIVVCCLCVFGAAAIWYLYAYGDKIFGLTSFSGLLALM